MPVALLPSPSRSLWHVGPIPLRAYPICVVLGIIVGLWIASRRYRTVGGRPGMILDIATVAIPVGLLGARLYSVLTDIGFYFGHGRDWVNVFNQQLYGRPSTLPWAVEISPAHRLAGFVNFATFQPTFLYESLWDALVGVAVILAARRFLLPGDRAFALYAGLYAVGRFWTQGLEINYSPYVLGLRIDQVVMVLILPFAILYLCLTRNERGPDVVALAGRDEVAAGSAAEPAPG